MSVQWRAWAEPEAAAWWRRGLSPRVATSLARGGYAGVDQVRAAADEDLLGLRNLGPTGLAEIRRVLGRDPRPVWNACG